MINIIFNTLIAGLFGFIISFLIEYKYINLFKIVAFFMGAPLFVYIPVYIYHYNSDYVKIYLFHLVLGCIVSLFTALTSYYIIKQHLITGIIYNILCLSIFIFMYFYYKLYNIDYI